MAKPYFKSNDPEDYKRFKQAIDDYMLQQTDPCAWATEQMFRKLKNPNPGFDSDSYDVEAWDREDRWIPKGTKYIP